MSSKRNQQDFSEELSERTPDGGGCAETWESLSQIRNEDSGRRTFLSHVAVTLGIAVGGAGATASSALAADEDPHIDTEEIRGRERGQILRRANRSEDVQFVADQLGEKPGVHQVVRYSGENQEGYAVTFGDPEEKGTTINYYESPEISGGSKANGGVPVGDGVRGASSDAKATLDMGTPAVEELSSDLTDLINVRDPNQSAALEQSILIRGPDQFEFYVPVVQAQSNTVGTADASNGDVVDNVVISGDGDPVSDSSVSASVGRLEAQDEVSIQSTGCVGPVCMDACDTLCTALAGLSGLGCKAACTATVAGIPISPGCGVICAAVAAGTCWPTCTNIA